MPPRPHGHHHPHHHPPPVVAVAVEPVHHPYKLIPQQPGYGTVYSPLDPPPHGAVPHEGTCAVFGCCFSWIPPIGLLTYAMNWHAPPGSRAAIWSRVALFVSVIVVLLHSLVWMSGVSIYY